MRQPGAPRHLTTLGSFEPPSQVEEPRSIESWLAEGIQAGFCTGWYCENHDGLPADVAEDWEALMEDTGWDRDAFCWSVITLKQPVSDGQRA
jgi:hypothetical protein